MPRARQPFLALLSEVVEVDEIDLAGAFAEAGLGYEGVVDDDVVYVPPLLATFARSEGGGELVSAETVANDDPLQVEKLNAAWLRMCQEAGFFDADRRFLVGIQVADGGDQGTEPTWWWAKVVLSAQWDLAGAGAESGRLGHGFGRPAFVMLSVDGNLVVRAAMGQDDVGIAVLRNPHRMPTLLRHGEWMANKPSNSQFTRTAIRRWLDAHSSSGAG